jgi:hypothetical protein
MSVMETKTAYIRKTGIAEMDQATLEHEFDELMQETSPHEIDGIRYKKSGNIFRQLLPLALAFIPGIGPALGFATQVGSTIHGASAANTAQKKAQGAFNAQQATAQSAFQPSSATQAFAPQSATKASPLSRGDFDTSLTNLSKNRESQRQSIFSQFRGLGTEKQNSALASNLKSAGTSSDLAKSTFLSDQKKLGSTFV